MLILFVSKRPHPFLFKTVLTTILRKSNRMNNTARFKLTRQVCYFLTAKQKTFHLHAFYLRFLPFKKK